MSFDKQQLNQKTRQAKGQVFVTPANLLCSPERVCQVLCLCHVAKTCLCHSSDPRIPHFATHRTWLMRPTAPGQVSEYQSEPQLPDPEAPPARKLTAAAKTQIDQRLWRYPQIKGASAGKGVRGVWGGGGGRTGGGYGNFCALKSIWHQRLGHIMPLSRDADRGKAASHRKQKHFADIFLLC